MKYFLVLLISALAGIPAAAQQINVVKTTIVGNKQGTVCKTMHPTSDGGIFWAGNTADTVGGGDYPVCTDQLNQSVSKAAGRLDAGGDPVWARVYCDGMPQPAGNCQPSDDSFLMVGPGIGDSANWIVPDIYIARLDCEGRLRRQYQWGSSGLDGAWTVIPASDGGFLAICASNWNDGDIPLHYWPAVPTGFSYTDVVAIKADSLGQKEWVKVIGSSTQDGCKNAFQVGDAFYLFIDTDGTHDYDFSSSAPYPPDSSGSYLVKLDGQGNLAWSRCIGSLGVNDALFDERDSTFMIVSGAFEYPPFYFDNQGNGSYTNYGLAKIDLQGQVKWAKHYGDANARDIPWGVCKVVDGDGYLIMGESYGPLPLLPPRLGQTDCWLVWTDTMGNLITDKYIGSAEYENPSRIARLGSRYIISTNGVYTSKPFTEGAWQYNPGVDYGVAFTVIELWPTGVSDVESKRGLLEVYPNPVQSELVILLPEPGSRYTIEVHSASGALAARYEDVKQKDLLEVSTSSWPSGTYTVSCKSSRRLWTAQVVVKH